MNTIIDLNIADNISYNNESSYAIVFGANAGNTTANIGALTTANITKQTTLTSITSAVRDLLIDVQFSNVGVVDMNYAGTYSNIGILQIAPATWRVSGIRSVVQYNEAFANVKYTDLTGIVYDVDPNYSYVTTVNDQSGNTRSWTTTVDVNAYINNMINRTYTTNNITQLFSTSTPSLDDQPDVGQTYTITLNSPVGKFGNSVAYFSSNTFANLANTYTFTGNTTTVNANYSNIRFAPTNRVSGNSTFTYTQSRDGNSQVSLTKTLTANVQAFGANTYTYTANTTFTPTFSEAQYGTANVLLVGGGGGASFGRENTVGPGTIFNNSGGGGGGGGILKQTGISLYTNEYTVTIGAGGTGTNTATGNSGSGNAGNGGNTSMTSSLQSFSTTGGEGGIFLATGFTVQDARGGQGGGTGGGLGGDQVGNPNDFGLPGTAGTGGGGGGGGNHAVGQAGGAGQTDETLGTAVFGGGGGSRRSLSTSPDGTPGGNSYGQGGSGVTGGTPSGQPGAAGVITIKIS